MSYRYYIQRDPEGIRRYTDETAERWDKDARKWTTQCAAEETCITTKDRLVTEAEALRFTKEVK